MIATPDHTPRFSGRPRLVILRDSEGSPVVCEGSGRSFGVPQDDGGVELDWSPTTKRRWPSPPFFQRLLAAGLLAALALAAGCKDEKDKHADPTAHPAEAKAKEEVVRLSPEAVRRYGVKVEEVHK